MSAPPTPLWRATRAEILFARLHDVEGVNIAAYSIAVAATKRLRDDDVIQAARHLYRKLPNLRVCQQRKDGQLWTCNMTEEKVLVKFLDETDDYEEVFAEETSKKFAVETGPMWRITVIPSRHTLEVSAFSSGFQHQYYLLFGMHHGITDGHSSVRMCGHFLELLNDVIEGTPINDEIQLAEFLDDTEYEKIMSEVKEEIATNPVMKNRYIKEIEEQKIFETLIFKSSICPVDQTPKTMSVHYELNQTQTVNFLARSKAEGVTIHSAFSSVIHRVLVSMLLEAGHDLNQYKLVSYHDINQRRYWTRNAEKVVGVHIGCQKTSATVPRDILKNFWPNVRLFHDQFQAELKDKYALKMPALDNSVDFCSKKIPCTNYYGISNMGDISKFFKKQDGSQHSAINACHVQRSTSLYMYQTAILFRVHTMNDKFHCNLTYNTRYLSKNDAEKLLKKIFNVLTEIMQ